MAGTRWLLVGLDAKRQSAVCRALAEQDDVAVESARTPADVAGLAARLAAEGTTIDLIVADAATCPTGDGGAALRAARVHFPEVRLVTASDAPTAGGAVAAMRAGAIDYLTPDDAGELPDRLCRAAARRWNEVRTDRRLVRLRGALRHLSQARRAVNDKVDLLCNDFVGSYGDLARQVESVRLDKNLRDLLASAADMEQLLCHLMDWLLRHAGHCNIAVFLTGEDGQSELGAYMKHTVAGEPPLVDWLARSILPRLDRPGVDVLSLPPELFATTLDPIDVEQAKMLDQHVLAAPCPYLGESMGSVLLFRDEEQPFSPTQIEALRLAAPAFAAALTALVRDDVPADDEEDDDDEGDWWKRGDAAPF